MRNSEAAMYHETDKTIIPTLTHLRARSGGLPSGLVVLAWYLVIKYVLTAYPSVVEAFIPEVWWQSLLARGLTILAMVALIPVTIARDGLGIAALRYQTRWTFRDLAWGLAAGAAIWMMHNALLDFAARWAGSGWVNVGVQNQYQATLRYLGPAEKFGLFYAGAVLTPVIEEIVYRACLLASFSKRWGGECARDAAYVLAGGMIFSVAHTLSHPLYTLVYAVTGSAFAILYMRSRSLNATILAHSLVNAVLIIRGFGH